MYFQCVLRTFVEFNAEFIKHMKEFVPSIMAEDKLMSNTIVRRDMKGKDLLEFVLVSTPLFNVNSIMSLNP